MKNTNAPTEFAYFLEIGKSAAREAGKYLTQKLGSAHVEYQKALNDDLLDADLEAERIILTILQKETPDIGILSEETGQKKEHQSYWIVDPLDGSANFQHSSPLFGVALALVLNQVTIGGVIYLPIQNEMFTALQNQGAFLNDQRIHVSSTETLRKSIIHIGDFAKGNDPVAIRQQAEDITELASHVRRIRMVGTATTDLVYVASGRADLLVNHTTSPWDIEAGKLILLEAGGKVSTKRIDNRTLAIYSNSIIHQEAEELLYSNTRF
jgi:myo-inositol-1(or 4)-monophosphatase